MSRKETLVECQHLEGKERKTLFFKYIKYFYVKQREVISVRGPYQQCPFVKERERQREERKRGEEEMLPTI